MDQTFGKRNWIILLIFGMLGQIAWSVENMYFNLFLFETVSPSLKSVTLMVQLSGITATVITLIAGTISDKRRNRRAFISYGYLLWGISVLIFAFISTSNVQKIFGIENVYKATTVTLGIIVAMDCVMTAFGSTANDACFNAWVTDNTKSSFRGRVESVLSILPLIAMLIVAGGFGIIVDLVGYPVLFLSLGLLISLTGISGIFLIKDAPTVAQMEKTRFIDIFYGFKPSVIKENKKLYLNLCIIGIFGIATQVFMPYLIIYMKTYLGFTDLEYSLIFGIAIIVGAIIAVNLGKVCDKWAKERSLYLFMGLYALGLLGMYFSSNLSKPVIFVFFGVSGAIMILGNILVSTLTGAMVRDNTPVSNVGKLQGIRMIFSVLLPMLIGPMIGNAINAKMNIPLPDSSSADVMTTSYIPAPEIFLVAAIITACSIAVIFVLNKVGVNKKMNLKTKYNVGDLPHSEYPRPQFVRDSYLCLNGKWKFCVTTGDLKPEYNAEILVPFSPESLNSGLSEKIIVKPENVLYYERKILLDESWLKGLTYLRFGAVDYFCEVFINGKKVGEHKGGYTAFSFEITAFLNVGENTLCVKVLDSTEQSAGGRGKQSLAPGGIWYTSQSGIWQTVWMENIPEKHISEINYFPDIKNSLVKVQILSSGTNEYKVFDNGNLILSGECGSELILKYDFELWSPENPKLYDIEVKCGLDKVTSYFAMRSFAIVEDKNGKKRLGLNGKPYFFSGLLDQGYWPDGLLTPPCDQAILDELTLLKSMGFNTLRKHIKVENMRWYYYCDKLGFIVWQDFVNGGGKYDFNHIATFPFLGFKHDDSDYKYFSRESKEGRDSFVQEWQETVSQLKNCVSVYMWTIFNEGWGQFDSDLMQELVKRTDDSRVIESVSGWHDYKNRCEIKSLHTYYTKLKVPKDKRPVTLSEFGGYSLKVEGHVFNEDKFFGYKKFKTQEEFITALKKLYLNKLLPLIKQGLSGAIYTQVSDVEEEINGLVTYDRKVIKIPIEEMNELNQALYKEANKVCN